MPQSVEAFIYRRFHLQGDLAALVCLLQEAAQADATGEQVTEASLREQLTWSGQNPACNHWVAVLPNSDTLVGSGLLQKLPSDLNADLHIVVHPSWRHQGIGTQLFSHLLARATELDAQALRAYVPVGNKAASLFVNTHGFAAVSTYTRLSVTGTQSFPTPLFPPGFTTRRYEQIEQVALYTEALNRCYEGYWGHLHCRQEDVAQLLLHLDHAGIFLLFAPDGTIAGTCRAHLSKPPSQEYGPSIVLIDAPGIVAPYREANLALPLLLTVLHWMLPQHPATIELEAWGEEPRILAHYRVLGFTPVKEEISYHRNLT